MTDPENTRPETLTRAAEIGKKAGLRYVYAGNLPGMVGDWENTRCAKCKQLLIERYGYLITGYFLTPQGCCPSCGTGIPGRWDPAFRQQITARPFVPRMRPRSGLLVLNSSENDTILDSRGKDTNGTQGGTKKTATGRRLQKCGPVEAHRIARLTVSASVIKLARAPVEG